MTTSGLRSNRSIGVTLLALGALGVSMVFGGCSSGTRTDTSEWRYSAPTCCDDETSSSQPATRYSSGQAITQYEPPTQPAPVQQQEPPRERIVTVYRDPQFNTAADFDFDPLAPTVLRRTTEVSIHRIDEICGPDGTCTIANHRDRQTHTATYTIADQGVHVSIDGGVKITEGGECPPGSASQSGDASSTGSSSSGSSGGDPTPPASSPPATEPTK